MAAPVYILGGYQTDFARNWLKEGKDVVAMMKEAVTGGADLDGARGERSGSCSRWQLCC